MAAREGGFYRDALIAGAQAAHPDRVPRRRLDVMMSRCYSHDMTPTARRSTLYLDPALHRALRVKAAETDRSMSDLVNDALRLALAEDAEDLTAFDERASEPNLRFEDVVKALKADGKI